MDEYCNRILGILSSHPRGLTNTQVAEEVGLSINTVGKKLDILEALGEIERESVGSGKKNYKKNG